MKTKNLSINQTINNRYQYLHDDETAIVTAAKKIIKNLIKKTIKQRNYISINEINIKKNT